MSEEHELANLETLSPIGYGKSSRCGYCGKVGESYAFYANAVSISPHFYQHLLDRCWRRSGKLLYRPDQQRSCCPHYTIRTDSTEFKPTRAQRQTVNRFNSYITGETYRREAARLRPRSKAEAKQRDNVFLFPDRIHESEESLLQTPPVPEHQFTVTLTSDAFTEEKWKVFDNYQDKVHHEPPKQRTRSSFKNFLCSSPLRCHTRRLPSGREQRLGSVHQCYRIDGRLVAVGVLDLLPDCVSSVYFFYHESIHKLVPGKIGALHEIALALEGGYKWWYPGFYIHSCTKMRYKLEYLPSYMLDPASLVWDPVGPELLKLLDQKHFVSLSLEKQNQNGQEAVPDQVSEGEPESIFDTGMVGIPSRAGMEEVDLDQINIRAVKGYPLLKTTNLRDWKSSTIWDWPLKLAIAELVAAIGPDLKDTICVDFVSASGG